VVVPNTRGTDNARARQQVSPLGEFLEPVGDRLEWQVKTRLIESFRDLGGGKIG
jgi:hypothetical protein